MRIHSIAPLAAATLALGLAGCATTESSRALEVAKPVTAATAYSGPRLPIVVGKFDNQSNFLRGAFSDGVDRLGGQAKTVLVSQLQQTNRFSMQDRDHLADTGQEAKLQGAGQQLKGASYVVTGAVTEFGRKEVGDHQFFGVLGRGKTQVAYAKVTLNVIQSGTSEVVFSAAGAGEHALSSREVVGFGSTAGYDSTLNGKVLDLAIREAVDRVVAARDAGQWGREAGR